MITEEPVTVKGKIETMIKILHLYTILLSVLYILFMIKGKVPFTLQVFGCVQQFHYNECLYFPLYILG